MTRILIIQGHPNPAGRLGEDLAAAYRAGAEAVGHQVETLVLSELEFPLLTSKAEWEGEPSAGIATAQQAILKAQHIVIIHPLWLGGMPALVKGFFEQVMRPGFAVGAGEDSIGWKTRLDGRTSRTIITMGMPAFLHRLYFGAAGLRQLRQSILGFVGIHPNRATLIGSVEVMSDKKRDAWLDHVRRLGRQAI